MATKYPNLDKQLGLHQRLKLLYVVDGFDAELSNEEGYPRQEYEGHGETIETALAALDQKLGELPAGFSVKHARVYP